MFILFEKKCRALLEIAKWSVVGSVALVFFSSGVMAQEDKTITRVEDFVVIKGEKIVENFGKAISSMALIAKIEGKIQPIPFQIDEINKKGQWVLPELPPESKSSKRDKDEDKGCVDKNDELVFMIRDAGDRIAPAGYPEKALAVDEITLTDPEDKGRAWVYLCSFSCPPPVSDKDYVTYYVEKNRVRSNNFELGFSKEVPFSWDHLCFIGQPNMFDRLKVRFRLKLLGYVMKKDETDFTSHLSSYKDGPIRVIRRVRSAVRMNRILKTPSAASETLYYDNAIVMPYRVKVPIDLQIIKKYLGLGFIKIRGGVDMQNLHGWQLCTDLGSECFDIDGKMDANEEAIAEKEVRWAVLQGPPGGFFFRIILDRTPDGSPQELPMRTAFYYMDNDDLPEGPEFVPGQSPNFGWWFHDFELMPKGIFYFYMVGFMVTDYKNGDEENLLNILDKPIQADVNPMGVKKTAKTTNLLR